MAAHHAMKRWIAWAAGELGSAAADSGKLPAPGEQVLVGVLEPQRAQLEGGGSRLLWAAASHQAAPCSPASACGAARAALARARARTFFCSSVSGAAPAAWSRHCGVVLSALHEHEALVDLGGVLDHAAVAGAALEVQSARALLFHQVRGDLGVGLGDDIAILILADRERR